MCPHWSMVVGTKPPLAKNNHLLGLVYNITRDKFMCLIEIETAMHHFEHYWVATLYRLLWC